MQSDGDGASSVLGTAARGWAAAGSIVLAGSSAAFPLAAWHGIHPGATSELLF